MKIIIPVRGNKDPKDMIVQGFHNSKIACIYNCVDDTCEWIETNAMGDKDGNLSLTLKSKGIYTIISNHMPLMALGLFVESVFCVYKAKSLRVEENIKLFNMNQLERYSARSDDSTSICSGSCGSCNTSTCKKIDYYGTW